MTLLTLGRLHATKSDENNAERAELTFQGHTEIKSWKMDIKNKNEAQLEDKLNIFNSKNVIFLYVS